MLKSSKSNSLIHLPTYNTPAALPSLQNALKNMDRSSSISLLSTQTRSNSYRSTTTKKSPLYSHSLGSTGTTSTSNAHNHHPVHITPDLIEHGSTTKRNNKSETIESFLRRVTHVSLVGKGITIMKGFESCRHLSVLYLYENSISKIEGLQYCVSLTRLYLQKNLIEDLDGLVACAGGLEKLSELHLAGNRIKHVAGLQVLPSLQVLHLDDQIGGEPLTFDASCMDTLGASLKKLTVAGNNIKELNELSGLYQLEEFDLSRNNVSDWEELNHVLASWEMLQVLNISSNPVSSIIKFRQKVILASPLLVTLNEKDISSIEREFLYNMETAKKKSKASRVANNQQSTHSSPINPNGPPIFALTMLGHGDIKPIPHLPPYASQYRDMMLHQLAVASTGKQIHSDAKKPLPHARTRIPRAPEILTPSEISEPRLGHLEEAASVEMLENELNANGWLMGSSSAASVFGSTILGNIEF